MKAKDDNLAYLHWLAHHPSLLVSGTAVGAIKAFEDKERELAGAKEELRQVAHAVARRGCCPDAPLRAQVAALVRNLEYNEAKTVHLLDAILGSPDHPEMMLTVDDGVMAAKAMKTWMAETWTQHEGMMRAVEYLAAGASPGLFLPPSVASAVEDARAWCEAERSLSV